MSYANDWGFVFPTGRSQLTGPGTRWWYEFLVPDSVDSAEYLSADQNAIDCPEGDDGSAVYGGYHSTSFRSGAFYSDDQRFVVFTANWGPDGNGAFMGIRMAGVPWPTEVMTFACTAAWNSGVTKFSSGYATFDTLIRGPGGGWKAVWTPHTSETTTGVFVDGHAEALGHDRMRSLKNRHFDSANTGMYSWFASDGEWIQP